MKKIILGSLIILSLVFAACDNPGDGEDIVIEKVVAEKYRGTWVMVDNSGRTIILTENTCKIQSNDPSPAWTVGADLYNTHRLIGTFISDDTFVSEGASSPMADPKYFTYKKQP